jgi:hypothetical protein
MKLEGAASCAAKEQRRLGDGSMARTVTGLGLAAAKLAEKTPSRLIG